MKIKDLLNYNTFTFKGTTYSPINVENLESNQLRFSSDGVNPYTIKTKTTKTTEQNSEN